MTKATCREIPTYRNYVLKGRVKITVKRGDGRIENILIPNVLTDTGIAGVAKLINGTSTSPFKYVAIGDGSSTSPGSCASESTSDTALGHELKRKAGSTSMTTTSVTDDTAVIEATFSSADGLSGSSSLCESGLFDADTGGTLLARAVFDVINLNWDNGDQITIRWEVQVQRPA